MATANAVPSDPAIAAKPTSIHLNTGGPSATWWPMKADIKAPRAIATVPRHK